SIVLARCLASAESASFVPGLPAPAARLALTSLAAVGLAVLGLAVLGLAGTRCRSAGLALRAAARPAVWAAVLRDDIDVVPLLQHLVLPQLQFAVGHAFAGLHVVLVAVPGTDEMHLGVGEKEPARRLVRHEPLFDLRDREPLAGRPALVEAEIAVS